MMLEWDAFKVVVWGMCILQIAGLLREMEGAERTPADLSKAAVADPALPLQLADAKLAYAALLMNLRRYNFTAYAARVYREGDRPC